MYGLSLKFVSFTFASIASSLGILNAMSRYRSENVLNLSENFILISNTYNYEIPDINSGFQVSHIRNK